MDINTKLAELGYEMPAVAKPVAVYVPYVESGGHLFLSGQLPMKNGELTAIGPVKGEGGPTLEQAQQAAAQCVLNGLAQINAAVEGDWDKIERVVRLGVFVAGGSDFVEHHLVANGASELLGKVLGERGVHARAAVGVPSLPLGASVELDMIVALRR